MNGQLFLADVFWTSKGPAPSLNGMIFLGVAILAVIVFAVLRNRAGGSGRSSSFDKNAFRKAARSAGLPEEEVRFLEEYGRALSLANPEFAFRNPQKLDAFFKEAYKRIDKAADSETDADERKARLFAARERLTQASSQGGAVRSTRQLGRGAPLTFIAPGEESYPSIILAVEPSGLAVEPVSDSYGEAIRFRRGTKLTCFFYAKGHQGYQFATRVSGWEKIGGKDAMVLGHSEAVSALPARRHARREMKAPCTFYRMAITAAKPGAPGRGPAGPRGQQKSSAKVENIPYPGTIVDISAGGLGIQTANPLEAGEYVKIAFSPGGGGTQAAFAKVIRMNKSKNIGGVMHVQFVKISRQSLNAIMSFVYGYAD
jgi:c-di-GMP-binding flagellar brake protein YcgR